MTSLLLIEERGAKGVPFLCVGTRKPTERFPLIRPQAGRNRRVCAEWSLREWLRQTKSGGRKGRPKPNHKPSGVLTVEVPATAKAAHVATAKAAHVAAAKPAEVAAAEAAHLAATEAAHVPEVSTGEMSPASVETEAVVKAVAEAVPSDKEARTPVVIAVIRIRVSVTIVVAGAVVRPVVVAAVRIPGGDAANHSGRDSGAGIVAVSVATSVSPGVMVMGHVVTGDIPVHAVCVPRMDDVLIMMSDGRRACARERRGQDKSGRAKRESRNSKSAKCHGDIPFRLATRQRRGKRPLFISDRSALFTDKIQGDHDFACSSLLQLSPPGVAKRSYKLKFRRRVFNSNTQGGRIPGAKPPLHCFLEAKPGVRLHADAHSLHSASTSASQFHRRQFSRKNKRSDALDDGADDPYLSAVSTPQD
jgi:hypothetical protein